MGLEPGLPTELRHCARSPFALEHLYQRDVEHLVYRNPQPALGQRAVPAWWRWVSKPLELITKIAALVPPPRAHRHRYYGVLAPNAPLRSVVTAQAPAAVPPAPAPCAPGMPLRGPATSGATCEEPVIVPWPAICKPCCWRASMRHFRCNARSATPPCASSPSSIISLPWARSSTTSAKY